jgi:hypothetical protein
MDFPTRITSIIITEVQLIGRGLSYSSNSTMACSASVDRFRAGQLALMRGLDRARLQRLNPLSLVIAPETAGALQKQVRRDKGVSSRSRTCSWLPPPSPCPAAHLCRSRSHDSHAHNRDDKGAQGPVPLTRQQAAHHQATGPALSSCTRATRSSSGCQAGPVVLRARLPSRVLHPRMSPVRTPYSASWRPHLWPPDLHRAAPGLAQPPRSPRRWVSLAAGSTHRLICRTRSCTSPLLLAWRSLDRVRATITHRTATRTTSLHAARRRSCGRALLCPTRRRRMESSSATATVVVPECVLYS